MFHVDKVKEKINLCMLKRIKLCQLFCIGEAKHGNLTKNVWGKSLPIYRCSRFNSHCVDFIFFPVVKKSLLVHHFLSYAVFCCKKNLNHCSGKITYGTVKLSFQKSRRIFEVLRDNNLRHCKFGHSKKETNF